MEKDTVSHAVKTVFFCPPDCEGSLIIKDKWFKLNSGNDENVVCDYIPFETIINEKYFSFKVYLVYEPEKFKEIRPLYFTDVHLAFLVFEIRNSKLVAAKKIFEDLKLNNPSSKIVFLGYNRSEGCLCTEMSEYIASVKGLYFEFSNKSDMEVIWNCLTDA